jgi:hypothetical protein
MNCFRKLLAPLFLTAVATLSTPQIHAATDSNGCLDTNGDGWGWFKGQRCQTGTATEKSVDSLPVVTQSAQQNASCVDPDGDGWGWDGQKSCRIESSPTPTKPEATLLHDSCLDTNGDGRGWFKGQRCQTGIATKKIVTPATQASAASQSVTSDNSCIDADGDGWGWDGQKSCRSTNAAVFHNAAPKITSYASSSGSTIPGNCDRINSGNYHITELVTDVFLSAGQSNAAGGQTDYNPGHSKDRINSRIIVWTENNRWEIADPKTQTWHDGKHPSGHGKYANHPAFQIARGIADNDNCRVVAFIATAASGMPINYWLNDVNGHYSSILHTVPAALNALPGKYKIDMIWWMQGEADDDQIVDRYYLKLTDLINRFRSQNWFDNNGLFVANETRIHTYANEAIRRLATDADSFTDYSRGADSASLRFPSIKPNGVHFNAYSLRQIGDLVADKYVYEYLPRISR